MAFKGSCHCNAFQFEVAEPPQSALRCNCSFCSKRGAVWTYYAPEQFSITAAPEAIPTYQWGSKAIKHHFCGTCGCSTFAESFNWETGAPHIAVNALLLDNVDVASIPIEDVDGRNLW